MPHIRLIEHFEMTFIVPNLLNGIKYSGRECVLRGRDSGKPEPGAEGRHLQGGPAIVQSGREARRLSQRQKLQSESTCIQGDPSG